MQLWKIFLCVKYLDTNWHRGPSKNVIHAVLWHGCGGAVKSVCITGTKGGYKFAKDIDLENLKEASKVEMYENCEPRLKSFIDSVTDNIKYKIWKCKY